MGLPALKRLRTQRDFLKVRTEGYRVLCGPFIFQCRIRAGETDAAGRRLGVIASRKVGGAVVRNRGKRIFRELFRLHEPDLPECSDTVIVLRRSVTEHDFADLEQRFLKACRNARRHTRVEAAHE